MKNRLVYIPSQLPLGQPIPKDEILATIAHEFGHVILGEGHPDNETGPAPLMGTDQVKRLMFSDYAHKIQTGNLNNTLLVKGEWDKAESWLLQHVDNEEE